MELMQGNITSAQDLLDLGTPFISFSEFSAQTLKAQPNEGLSREIETKIIKGRPFTIRGFHQSAEWQKVPLNRESLVTLSPSGVIPVTNCETGRNLKMRLRDLSSQANHARTGSLRESLYAKDLQCPKEWESSFQAIIPSSLLHLGPLDLFRFLPKEIAPEVLMAYVGTKNSFSGFHRCFSATVAVNLMIESEGNGPGSICFGTDTSSQKKFDEFMVELGKSAHTDWANVPIDKLRSADFPIYVTDQRPGDLVVFPSASAHQVWNISAMVTRLVWNIMHHTSVSTFFNYVEPVYQKHCHPDTGRVPLIPLYALQSGRCTGEDQRRLWNIFRSQFLEENIERVSSVPIKLVDTQGAVVECNFCGLTIWNRHLHCEKCGDFDLCLTCFISGRSCKHVADYTWAEIIPRSSLLGLLSRASSMASGTFNMAKLTRSDRPPLLGAAAAAALNARQQSSERLCHLCRDSHPTWKGITCAACSAFFCFRGLHRHFDIDIVKFLQNGALTVPWNCPKCSQICNCRCCHFSEPYQSKDKPVRARIKSIDPRGRIPGFADNVFNQKRGKRASAVAPNGWSPQPDISSRGVKRLRVYDEPERSIWQEDKATAASITRPNPTRRSDICISHSTNSATPDRNNMRHTPIVFDPPGRFRMDSQVETRSLTSEQSTRHLESPAQRSNLLLPAPSTDTQDQSVSRRYLAPLEDKADGLDTTGSISIMERKLDALREYAYDLFELDLVESRAKIVERISQLEIELEQLKRRKTEKVLANLSRDFPDLADVAREEARRRGL
ncbi:hypothetical protein BJY01DRAFT_231789 [Aspergillus pseudoustus]|uniref:JmjC domain-containing protein n=1 Tax=Aspergillus pseudoustus TaxID=1810923 RepID=A0ABR4KRC6_9EURO